MSHASSRHARHVGIACVLAVIAIASCGGGNANGTGNTGSNADGGTGDGSTNPNVDGATASDFDSGYVPPNIDSGTATAPGPICTPPITAVDVSTPTSVVGNGSAGSCTETALASAVALGGIITFNCGGKVTIPITEQIAFPKIDTTLDGGNVVTLDGGGTTRLLSFNGGDYRKTTTLVTIQNIALVNAKSSGTKFAAAAAPCPQGAEQDGGGGAILFNDGKLHVIHVDFTNDEAEPLGPDVAGGAIYVTGALEAIVVDSTFTDDTASNGGAIGALNAQLDVYNSAFAGSRALGKGANYSANCVCAANNNTECGSGGNGGTVSMDGGDDTSHTFCGDVFRGGQGGSGGFGGAISRTPDKTKQPTTIDRCTFDSNSIDGSGGAMYFHNSALTILASTVSNNTSNNGAGGIWVDGTTIDFENLTLVDNGTNVGLGAGLFLAGGNDGSMKNVTIAGNHIDGIPTKTASYFGAGIAGGDTITLLNSIVAHNTDHDPYNPVACFFNPEMGDHDIQYPQAIPGGGNDKPCVAAPIYEDPKLGALANNGGPTLTAQPQTGSPAIGAGDSATCTTTDQRGQTRKMPCTLGAVEGP